MLSYDEINEKILESKSQNTKKNAMWAMRIFENNLKQRYLEGKISVLKEKEEHNRSDVCYAIKHLVFEVKNQDNEKYTARTMKSIVFGILWYYKL
jgi:pyruvate/oxaloacetate carboxyltransferase